MSVDDTTLDPRKFTPKEIEAAQRMRDAVNLHVLAGDAAGREQLGFVAIRLADGSAVDNTLYDSRAEAVYHTRNDSDAVFYVHVQREPIPLGLAMLMLQQHRQAYRTGHRFAEEALVTPQLREQLAPFLPRTLGGLR